MTIFRTSVMGKMKDDRESAPSLYILLDAREKLKEFSELSSEVELSLKRTFQLLVKKPRNYARYPEIVRAGLTSETWELGSEHPYPRIYCCLWCKGKWTISNSDEENQWVCPNSCNENQQ